MENSNDLSKNVNILQVKIVKPFKLSIFHLSLGPCFAVLIRYIFVTMSNNNYRSII